METTLDLSKERKFDPEAPHENYPPMQSMTIKNTGLRAHSISQVSRIHEFWYNFIKTNPDDAKAMIAAIENLEHMSKKKQKKVLLQLAARCIALVDLMTEGTI